MINVVFFPGTYGHYFSSCISFYSDLEEKNTLPEFGSHGSSHNFNKNKVLPTHDVTTDKNINEIVYLKPHLLNQLDYLDNQFEKAHKCNLTKHLDSLSLNKNISDIWKLREDISFWIEDLLNNSYNSFIEKINKNCLTIDVNSLFDNFLITINYAFAELSLDKTVSDDVILKKHNDFLELQKNHNKQIKVKTWIDHVIDNNNLISPCDTIFDEAYAQNLLRKAGYEIKCYNLNTFPKNSQDLRNLII